MPPRNLRQWPERNEERDAEDRSDFSAWAELVQRLAEDGPGVLRRLAALARESSRAVFVALARGAAGGRGVSFVATDGPPGTEAALGQDSFVPIWRAALDERRTISGEAPAGHDARIHFHPEPIDSLLAIPLEARGEVLGLLVAG